MALKETSLDDVRDYERFLRTTAGGLYAGATARRETCPCCNSPSQDTEEALRVFDVAYVRCASCGHGYVLEQPVKATLDDLFEHSEEHSSTYTDPAAVEIRMSQVVRPKVRWVLDVWAGHRSSPPQHLVDVGAGGGHMVAGFREAGIAATGHELSASSRRFARETFGIELGEEDFLTSGGEVDVVTMWGLLEYTADPAVFLQAARRRLVDTGLLVVEVPRLDCLGTAVQAAPDSVVSRHLDPTTHVNCFSDASLATLLDDSGFAPVAAWYFGMDAHELLVQTALRLGERRDDVLATLAPSFLALQGALDRALSCDDLVLAAVPA